MVASDPHTDLEARPSSRPPVNHDHVAPAAIETPPSEMDLEKLGRQRPAVFSTRWAEIGFVVSLLGSMIMAVRLFFPFSLPQTH